MGPANVTFEGHVGSDRVRAAMRSAKFLVVPSLWYESMAMVVLEAFANGLPVVAYRHGSFVELIGDGVTGRLVSPVDPVALATTLAELLHKSNWLNGMRAAALHPYARTYTPEHHPAHPLAIYH